MSRTDSACGSLKVPLRTTGSRSDCGHGRPSSFPSCARPFRWPDAMGNAGHGMPAEAAVACSSSASWPPLLDGLARLTFHRSIGE